TLVGFANRNEVKGAITTSEAGKQKQGKLQFGEYVETLKQLEEKAQGVEQLFNLFREQQTELGGVVTSSDKQALTKRLKELEDDLDRYLAFEYGINQSNIRDVKEYEKRTIQWRQSHQPFHWFIEFYGIMKEGGFDVIIGNPPYLEKREVNYELRKFECLENGAVHAMCVERSDELLQPEGCMSMIVPMALVSTQRMNIVQKILEKSRNAWYSNYSWRPAKIFDTVNRALTIFAITPSDAGKIFSTNYQKWISESRDTLMFGLQFVKLPRQRSAFWVPKLGEEREISILKKCLSITTLLSKFMGAKNHRVYHRTTGGLYWKVFTDFPPAFKVNGRPGHSTRETWFTVLSKETVRPIIAILSSNLFWWWYTITTNCRDLNPYDIHNFPIPETTLKDEKLDSLGERYLKDLEYNSIMLVRQQKQTGRTETQSFKIQKSKHIIDEIDHVLAEHYGLTDEELDFIINYDIKYRMGIK
ncbi:Eco57I restriction-modification methylase domain-containing protein, partial [bacterium]|nr:Eco57I restriction-modification methylase domain-containing protein [bacterium]